MACVDAQTYFFFETFPIGWKQFQCVIPRVIHIALKYYQYLFDKPFSTDISSCLKLYRTFQCFQESNDSTWRILSLQSSVNEFQGLNLLRNFLS